MITKVGRELLEMVDKNISRWGTKKILSELQTIDRDFDWEIKYEAKLINELGNRNITVRGQTTMGRMKDIYIGTMEQVEDVMEKHTDKNLALDEISKNFGEHWREYAEEHFVVTGIDDSDS